VHALAVDASGLIWIGTNDGLGSIDGTTRTMHSAEGVICQPGPCEAYYSVAVDASGKKWCGTDEGLVTFDDSTWEQYWPGNSPLPCIVVKSVAIDASGAKWIGTEGGLVKFDGSDWAVYDTSNSPLPGNAISAVAVDMSGTVWAGIASCQGRRYGGYACSNGYGLVAFDGSDWTVYTAGNSGLPDDCVQAIAVDKNNNKWIATREGGLAVLNDDGVVRSINRTDKMASNTDYAISASWKQQSAQISYAVRQYGHVSLNVMDVKGRLVKPLVNTIKAPGNYHESLDTRSIAAGAYIVKLEAGGVRIARNIVISR
jgi:ligand-binding sensor domain-containing protein